MTEKKINEEIFGGLISALSRGESLQKAMISLWNAGYSKKEIEDAAGLLKSKSPSEIIQKTAEESVEKKETKNKGPVKKSKKGLSQKKGAPAKAEKKSEEKQKTKQHVSAYGEQSPEEFKKILDSAIKNLTDLKGPIKIVKPDSPSKPPIIIQQVSDYSDTPRKTRKGSKPAVIILFVLLAVLLGSLVALFIFKDRLIEIFNNLGF